MDTGLTINYTFDMFFATEPIMVENDASLKELCSHLSTQHSIAVDLEGDSLHHFKERLCLMQVSDLNQDYIVDLVKITDFSPMTTIMENPDILKIMHGADYDVVSLKRDYKCHIKGLFDTAVAAQFLDYDKFGLAHLIEKHFGLTLEKKYQKHDWSRRPLYQEHIDYARSDTHFLLSLQELLKRQLLPLNFIEATYEESEHLTGRVWNGRAYDEYDFLRVKKAHQLSEPKLKVLRGLFEHRDTMAAKRDSPVFHFASDGLLWLMAEHQPTDLKELLACVQPKYYGLIRRYADIWLPIIKESINDERPIPEKLIKPQKRKKNRWMNVVISQIRDWRVEQKGLGHHDFLLPTNNQIKDLAFDLPESFSDVQSSTKCRNWQLERWGQSVLDIIASITQI